MAEETGTDDLHLSCARPLGSKSGGEARFQRVQRLLGVDRGLLPTLLIKPMEMDPLCILQIALVNP